MHSPTILPSPMHSPMLSTFINALLCSAPLYSLHQYIHQHSPMLSSFTNAFLCSCPWSTAAACYDFFTRGGAHGISECIGLWSGEVKLIFLCKHQDGAPSAKPYYARSNDCENNLGHIYVEFEVSLLYIAKYSLVPSPSFFRQHSKFQLAACRLELCFITCSIMLTCYFKMLSHQLAT